MTAWIAMGIVTLLFLGPLVWRTWREHLEDRALPLQADLQAAVNHALGGESLVTVRVKAGAHDGTGSVEIYVPAGWENVLVFRPRPASAPAPLRRAA